MVDIIISLQTQLVFPGKDNLTDPPPWLAWPDNVNERLPDF